MLLCTTVLSKLAIDYSLMGEDRERPLIEALSDFMPLLKALWDLKEGIPSFICEGPTPVLGGGLRRRGPLFECACKVRNEQWSE